MERFTGWDNGNGYMLKCFEAGGCPDLDTEACGTCECWIEAWKRFAAYEDTGLIPEKVAEFVYEGLLAALDKLAEFESTGLSPAECAEFAEAKVEGRVVIVNDEGLGGVLNQIADYLKGLESDKRYLNERLYVVDIARIAQEGDKP